MTGDKVEKSIIIVGFFVLAVAVISVAMALYFVEINEKSENKLETITASISMDFGNETVWNYEDMTVDGESATVFGFLLAAAQEGAFKVTYTYYGQYDSYLVDSINEVINGENNKYWQYWINREYGMVGADKQPVNNGDIIEWKFTGFS